LESRVPKSDHQFNPDITVATILVREGRFLMVEENVRGRLVLNQPAGHLEPNESLIDAAIREVLEETAWEARLQHFVGTYRWVAESTGKTYLRFGFVAEAVQHRPEQALDNGIERTLWLSLEELRAQTDRLRSPLVLALIEDYLAGQRFPLSLLRELA
jgi:8-oxo-dGTP pyrophosphatase MutT (NUDIX family)